MPSSLQFGGPSHVSGRRHAAVCRRLYVYWWPRLVTIIALGASPCYFLPCNSTVHAPGLFWLSLCYALAMLALTVVTSLLLQHLVGHNRRSWCPAQAPGITCRRPGLFRFSTMSGPKSGRHCCRLFSRPRSLFALLIVWAHIHAVSGVRVGASASQQAPGVSPSTHHRESSLGEAKIGTYHEPNPSTWHPVRKRAFRRAIARARRSPDRKALYRGGTIFVADDPKGRAEHAVRTVISRLKTRISIMTWNCGGLTTLRFAELKEWLRQQSPASRPQLLVLQETLWRGDFEWTDDMYTYLHSGSGQTRDSGILTMVSRLLCAPDLIRHASVQPGRLMHIKICLEPCVEVLAVYQHAWRPEATANAREALLAKRLTLWHRVQRFAESTALRSQLIVLGDFNTPLSPQHPFTGQGLRGQVKRSQQDNLPDRKRHAPDGNVFRYLLQCCDLQAINTFRRSGTPCATFRNLATNAFTQIDFILVRRQQADDQSRMAAPARDFPLLPVEGMFHYPVVCSLPRAAVPRTKTAFHRLRPDQATLMLQRDPAKGQLLQQLVRTQLKALPSIDLVNEVLLSAWRTVFNDASPTRAPTSGPCLAQLWHHRRMSTSAHTVYARWRHLVKYRAVRKALQARAVVAKRAKLQQQLHDAEVAESSGQPSALYQVLRRIAPKIRRRRMQLRDEDNCLAGPQAEARLVAQHFATVFDASAAQADFHLQHNFYFTAEEFHAYLQELPSHKALPVHCAPAPLWKLCSKDISSFATAKLGGCLHIGSFFQQWPEEWKTSYLCLLPKTDQVLDSVSKMRPISLLHPLGKSFAGLLMGRIKEDIVKRMEPYPQFAYVTGRSALDAIDRAFFHVCQTQARTGQQYTIHHRRAGFARPAMLGSVTLSVDLSRAFDSVSRSHIKTSLEWANIPESIIGVILGVHHAMILHYASSGAQSTTSTGQGVRQGCRLAPILWCCFTGWLLSKLTPLLSASDLASLITFFADDMLYQWEVSDVLQMQRVLRMIGFILDFLEHHGLQANLEKTVVLAKFVGHQHTKAWSKNTERHPDRGLCVRISTANGTVLLPIKSSHKYLGVQLSYKHMIRDTVQYRIKCANSSFARINVALKRTSKLSLRGRIRLWQAIVHSTLRYGISSTGLDKQTLGMYKALFMRQLRAICDSPVHLTRESNEALLIRVGVDCPLHTVACETAERHRQTAQKAVFALQPNGLLDLWTKVHSSFQVSYDPAHVVGSQPATPAAHHSATASAEHYVMETQALNDAGQFPRPVEPTAAQADVPVAMPVSPVATPVSCNMEDKTALFSASETAAMACAPDPSPAPPPVLIHTDFRCPVCEFQAEHTTALRYHMSVKHGMSERDLALSGTTQFRFEQHALAGMPTCRHCRRAFTGVPQLRNHILAQVCPVLHGATASGRDYGQQPALPVGESLESTPLKDRASTAVYLEDGGWRALADSPGFQQVALSHCPLCHQWVANASGQVKKHITQKHKEHAAVVKRVIDECRKDTTELVSPCQLCSRTWKGPKIRHRGFVCSRLLAALHQPSAPITPAGTLSDHDAQVTPHRVRGDLQQHVSGSGGRAETGQTGFDGGSARNDGLIFESSQGQRQGQEQKGRQQRKRQGSHHVTTDAGDTAIRSPGLRVHESGVGTSIPTALASGSASTLHAGPQLSGEHNESASHASRDGAHGSSSGHGICDASGSGNTGHHSAGLSGEQGIPRSEVSAASHAAHLKADHAHDSVSHSSRSTQSVGHGCQERPATGAPETGMVPSDGRSVALSQVVGGEGELGSGGAAQNEPTCSIESPLKQHPGEPRGKQHLVPVQHNQAPHGTDGSDTAILHQSLSARRQGPGSLSTASSSVRPRMSTDDRHDSAAGKTRASEVIETASAGDEAVVTSSTPARLPSQLDCNSTRDEIRAWKLLNQGRNSCYANSLLLSLLWSETYLGCSILEGPLGSSLRTLAQAGRAVDVWSIMPWINATRNWHAPRQQHDIAEFLLFMRSRLSASVIDGTWGAAGSTAPHRGLEVVDNGPTWPLLLADRPTSAHDVSTPRAECSLQDLIACWHEQAEPRALLMPPRFCAIQVGRFDKKPDGRCIKSDFMLKLEPVVHVPTFHANLQDVYFVKYSVRACAVHHGPTPTSGHYRSVLLPSDGAISKAFYTDDNATARKIKSSELVGVQRNAYIVFLQRTD